MKLRNLVTGLALTLAACNVASIVTIIAQAAAIAEQAAAISGVLPPQYADYVSSASECIAFAAQEEASADSQAVKADKIVAQCAQLTSVVLPPGTAKDAAAIAARLALAIQKILAGLPASKPLSPSDIDALGKIAVRGHEAARKVRAR